MTFRDLLTDYNNHVITFDELVDRSKHLTWGERVAEPDGSVDWFGENVPADLYNTVSEGTLTAEERRTLLETLFPAE